MVVDAVVKLVEVLVVGAVVVDVVAAVVVEVELEANCVSLTQPLCPSEKLV